MKKIYPLVSGLALFGLLDALYLTYEHYNNVIPPCSLHAWFSDCGKVLSSSYATLFGIPVSLFGVLYYLVSLGTIGILIYRNGYKPFPTILRITAVAGFVAALYFISLQLFVLHAICPYCTVSDSIDIVIFLLVFSSFFSHSTHKN